MIRKLFPPIAVGFAIGAVAMTAAVVTGENPTYFVPQEGAFESRIKVEIITVEHHRFAVTCYAQHVAICEVTEASHD